MRAKATILALLAGFATTGAGAETYMDRAAGSLDGHVDTTDTFTDSTVEEVVTPYETSSPPEAGMSHTTFEDRISNTREADNDQGRVLRATEDSAKIRPKVDIDGQGPLFDDANWAHENAEDIAGKYFSSETGSCTTPELPVSELSDAFCESLPARETRTCRLIRKVWADRTDTYRCDRRAAKFVKVCEKTNSYSCKVNSTKRACIQSNVRITGGSVSWAGRVATISFPAPDPVPGKTGFAALVKHEFAIEIADRFNPTEVMVKHVDTRGVLQLTTRANDNIFGTFADNRWHAFGGSDTNCPANDRSGLLVPLTEGQGCVFPEKDPQSWAVVTPKALKSTSNYRALATGRKSYKKGWDVSEGISGWLATRLHFVEICEDRGCGYTRTECWAQETDSCFRYANVADNASVSRDTVRYLPVNSYARADPEGARRFMATSFTARVVYTNGIRGAGRSKISIRFDGDCCDSFSNVGSAQCD